ncbi:uncharacterized protein HKW66_Vig0005380 [Vigna angularis]|uniref:Uncharacterized protein n=2 Tax=Phaseolus angularis TaxID=3914 RepID=A0A8T0LHI5_PHAAN|nr:uncharacterized protein HKW66_Vig0005380 [Vigna angularis]BAT74057.1 hypothetical protein VIGAN_01164500 [Vigna angularis var. angularis]
MSIARFIKSLQLTTLRNLTTQIIVAHIQTLQILKRRKNLRKIPVDTVVPKIQTPQVLRLRQPYFSQIESQQVLRQVYLLQPFLLCPKQHRRISFQHVLRQVHERQVQLRQRRRNLAGEAVAGECQHREMLRKGAEGVRDGAGDVVAVEGDSEEVGERGEGGREGAGEGVVGEINGQKGFHLGQEMGYLTRDVGVGDVEVTEFGELCDGGGDWTDEVVDAANVEKTEVGEVGDGGRDRVGFGEAKVGKVETVDPVRFGVDVA